MQQIFANMGDRDVCHPVTLQACVPETLLPTTPYATIPSVSELIQGSHLMKVPSLLQPLQMEGNSDKTQNHLEMSPARVTDAPLSASDSFSSVLFAEQAEGVVTSSSRFAFPTPPVSTLPSESSAASTASAAAVPNPEFHVFDRLTSSSQVVSPLHTRVSPQGSIMMVQHPRHTMQREIVMISASLWVPAQCPGEYFSYGNPEARPCCIPYWHTALVALGSMLSMLLPVIDHNHNLLIFPSHESLRAAYPLQVVSQQDLMSLVSKPTPHPAYAAGCMVNMLPYGVPSLYVPFVSTISAPVGGSMSNVDYSLQSAEHDIMLPHCIQVQEAAHVTKSKAMVLELFTSKQKHAMESKHRVVKLRRTRSGCLTCRKRHIKCDEHKPHCLNCEHLKKLCLGYEMVDANGKRHKLKILSR